MSPAPYPSIASIGEHITSLILGHMGLGFRAFLAGPGVDADSRFVRLVTGQPHPFGNFAFMTNPVEPAGVRQAIEPLMRVGAPAAVLIGAEVSDPVRTCLNEAGFTSHGGLPAMAVEIDLLRSTGLPDGYQFDRAWKHEHREAWADAFVSGYGLPAPLSAAFASTIDGNRRADAPVQHYWIIKNGRPVCTSLLFLSQGVAGVYCVATHPDERGKGLGAFVTAEPLRIARQMGYRVGVLQSSEAGYPVYRKLGFLDFGQLPRFLKFPAGH